MSDAAKRPTGLLGDLRVLELGGEAGAWCGKLLADMGANVMKVEPPKGDPTRSYGPFYEDKPGTNRSLLFWHYNTNKKSITLDVGALSGQNLFRRLVGTADVLIDSCHPGELDGLGIGYDALRTVNPGLIMASITPFGQQGPYKDYAATDLTVMAFGGPVWNCGYDDHSLPPVRGGGNQGYHTACHFAVISILVALSYRHRSGLGQFIDVNMHAASNVSTEAATYVWLVSQATIQRQTGRHAAVRPTPPSQVQCGDGRYVNTGVGSRSEEEWINLVAWLDEEGVLDMSGYLVPASREALMKGDQAAREQWRQVSEAIHALAQKKNAYDLYWEAQQRGLQWGIVYSPDEALEDPHLQARGFLVDVEHAELGKVLSYPGAPYHFSAAPWAIRRRAPLLGEDNYAVYVEELGLRPHDLVALTEGGVI